MKRFLFIVTLLIGSLPIIAQNSIIVKGSIKDSLGTPIIGANIKLTTSNDTIHTTSNEQGNFQFFNVNSSNITLYISMLGYQNWVKVFEIPSGTNNYIIPTITILYKSNILREVIVKAQSPIFTIKDDTIEYKVKNFPLRENAVIEDLLKRLPGISVDLDGNISYLGKKISKIKINGQDFIIKNIQDLTRLFPTSMIDKVQLIEDYGITAAITGRKIGSYDQILNLELKSELKNSHEAKLISGIGPTNKYNFSLLGTLLQNKSQLITSTSTNNTDSDVGNKKTFTSNSSYAYTGEFLRSNLSFSMERNSIQFKSLTNTQVITSEGILQTEDNTDQINNDNNYSIGIQEDYNPTNKTRILFSLNGAYGNNNNSSNTVSNQSGLQNLNRIINNEEYRKNQGLEGNILYVIPMEKKDRKLYAKLTYSYKDLFSNQTNLNQLYYFNSDTTTVESVYNQLIDKHNKISAGRFESNWIEPISKTINLSTKYGLIFNSNKYAVKTYDLSEDNKKKLIDSLSSDYKYNSNIHYVEINAKMGLRKVDYLVGGLIRLVQINSRISDLKANYWNQLLVSPLIQINYKLTNEKRLRLSYTNILYLPEYFQIQPIPDKTNFQFPIIGNPNLKATTLNSFNLEYRKLGTLIYQLNFNANINKNSIVTNTILIKDTFNTIIQETHFLNTNGDYDIGLGYNVSKQLKNGQFNISLEGSNSFRNNILYQQNIKKNTQSLTIRQAIRLGAYTKELELSSNIDYLYNKNIYLLTENNTIDLQTWNLALAGKFYFLKNWSISFTANKQLNYGSSTSGLSNPLIIGAKIEKTAFHNLLTFRLQGYNLLDQVNNFSQSISSNSITRSSSNLTGRFYLFSVMLEFKNLKSP